MVEVAPVTSITAAAECPTFSRAPQLLLLPFFPFLFLLLFFLPSLEATGGAFSFSFFFSVTWKLFSNNSQMSPLVGLFLSSQGVTCCAVFSSVWLGPPP